MGGGGAFRRLLLRILGAVLPSDWAGDIVRDLEEAHTRRRRAHGALRTNLWLTAQAVVFAAHFGVAGVARAARRAARRAAPGRLATTLARDVAHTLRTARRAPLFHAGILLILAVGVGANTAIFSIVRAVVLEPLPHPGAHRLLVLDPTPWIPTGIVTDLRAGDGLFDGLVGSYPRRFTVTGGRDPLELEGAEVTPDFLPFLGAEVVHGRHFVEGDAGPGAAPTAILSWDAWQRHLGGAPDAVGRTLRVGGVPREVVGVTARGFRAHTPRSADAEIWIPGRMDRLGLAVLPEGSPSWAVPVARLAEGVPAARARRALEAAVARYLEDHPEGEEGLLGGLRWTHLRAHLTRDARPALLMLQGAVGLVLLLACVNVANLLLVRAGLRRDELAVRTALGASRTRLLGQRLTESVVLAILGGLGGLSGVLVVLDPVLALAPADLPRLDEVTLDTTVLLFALALSVLTGLACGLLPAAVATRSAPGRILKEEGRSAAGSRRRHRLSQALVVTEITATLVLVAGAGLLGRSFVALSSQPLGFRTRDVLAVPLRVPDHRYGSVPMLEEYHRRLLERLGREPGVRAVAVSNNVPLERGGSRRLYVVEGETEPREAQYGVVSPGYFPVLDIPLLRGRGIEEGDTRDAPRVAVIDEVMRRRVWPGVDPVGRRFRLVDRDEWITVVGVSAAVRGSGPARDPGPGFHIPYLQRPATPVELGVGRDAVLLVRRRVGAGVQGLPDALRGAIREVDPLQAVPRITTLESIVSAELGPQRFRTVLLGAFAGLALVLAVSGIAGVVGHVTTQRIHEFGIRRAVGATGTDVLGSVLGWGLRLGAVGVALGLLGVLLLRRYLGSLLFGVTSSDPPTLVAAVAVVLVATLGACLIPALQAVRVDAVVALRGGRR